MTTLPISDLVSVSVNVAGPGISTQNFGTPLVLGLTVNRLPPSDRVRYYNSLPAVAADYQATDQEYLAAAVWFAKTDVPVPPLAIAYRWTTAQAGALYGAVLTAAQQAALIVGVTSWTNTGFDVALDGTNKQIFAADLHAQNTMQLIASALQTKLAAALSGTTCTWTGARFVITSPTTGALSSVGFAVAPTGGTTPTDISAALGFTVASGAYASVGAVAEADTTASLTTINGLSSQWYAVHLTSDHADGERTKSANWCVANNRMFLHTETSAAALTSGDSTSIAYLRFVAEVNNAPIQQNVGATLAVYSANSNYTALGLWANQGVVQWGNADSTITLNLKPIAGVLPDNLTLTQKQTLLAKNCNAFVMYGSPASSVNVSVSGVCSSGRFADEIVGLAWFQNQLQTDLFNFEVSRAKIPQTNAGVSALEAVVVATCEKAVRNGLFAAGIWTGPQITSTAGDVLTYGDVLKTGYKILIDTVESQAATDRAVRKAPPIKVATKGANAMQNIVVTTTFAR